MSKKHNPRQTEDSEKYEGRIFISSLKEASYLLSSNTWGNKIRYVVSIGSPRENPPANLMPKNFRRNVLRLEFDDNPRIEGDIIDEGPQLYDMEKLISWGEKSLKTGEIILCHCQAGISRSSAAAFTLHCMDLGPGMETEAKDQVLLSRPIAYPNLRMVSFADFLLERDGAMVNAFQERFKNDSRLNPIQY